MSDVPTEKTFEVEIIIQIPFNHIDPMNIVWHGHYLEYFEVARAKLFEQFNYSYAEMKESGFAWPIIDTHIRYIKPALLGQKIKIKAWLAEYDFRLKVKFLVTDAQTGERMVKGSTTQVAVDMKTMEMCFGTPDVLYEKLGIKK